MQPFAGLLALKDPARIVPPIGWTDFNVRHAEPVRLIHRDRVAAFTYLSRLTTAGRPVGTFRQYNSFRSPVCLFYARLQV